MIQVTIVPLKPFERATNPTALDTKCVDLRAIGEGNQIKLARHPAGHIQPLKRLILGVDGQIVSGWDAD